MANTKYNSTDDMAKKLQQLKGKTKFIFFQNISIYNDNMDIRMDEGPCTKSVLGISEIYHEVLMLMTFLQSKPQFKNFNTNYYDLYYTVIQNRDGKEFLNDQYENDYINFKDFIPNHYIGNEPRETILR